MCKNIVEKGNHTSPLLIYNRSTERAIELRNKLGADEVEVIEDISKGAARADVILICLSNDEAVQQLMPAIVGAGVEGKLIVDCSTIHHETTEAIAKSVTDKGADFVAAPVFGAPAMADSGQLIALLAGPKLSVDRARPWFKGITARAEIDLTDQPYGKASKLKVLGNSFIMNMITQLAEAHVVAEKSGLGTDIVQQFVGELFPGPYAAYSSRMLTGDYHKREEPLFAVELARKDVRHGQDLASTSNAKLTALGVADEYLKQVIEQRGDKADVAGIYGVARQNAGLPFEN